MTALLVIGIIIAIILIVPLFTKKDYGVQREIIINKPSGEVFEYVRYLRNQDHYNKWVMRDPNMKKDFRGKDGQPGFVYAWDSKDKNAGKGEQEITGIVEGQKIDVEIRFERPFKAIAYAPIKTEQISAGKTKITWQMRSQLKYPMNAMLLFVDFDKVLGKDMETSLQLLKHNIEQQPVAVNNQ